MSTVGVRELKNRLTHYLHRTKRGEEVVVTERGNPIAILRPIRRSPRPSSLEARLAELAGQGILTPATRRRSRSHRPIRVRGRLVSETILEDRR